jgi:CheY-like chemotaxis protein
MAQEERDSALSGYGVDELVEGIWEESTRLETVLVVHGYDSLREALARTLQHYGYRSLEASSREQALRLTRSERPAVILLDLALGDADGPALAAELAGRPESRGIPLLALTSDVLSDEARRRHGLREALVMPVEQKDLLAALDRALEPARRRASGNLRLEPSDEQCRLPLEDRLRSEHLSLFFRFPTSTRVELHPGSEMLVRGLSARLAALGVQPEVELDGGDLLLRYELSIADALSLESADSAAELFTALREAFPELAARPEALRRRIGELQSEYRRLQRLAS